MPASTPVARTASIGRLALRAPRLRVERDAIATASAAGRFERWRAAPRRDRAGIVAQRDRGARRASAARPRLPRRPRARAPRAPLRRPGASPSASSRSTAAASLSSTGAHRCRSRSTCSTSPSQLRGFALDSTAAAPFHVAARVSVPAGPSGKAVGSGVVGSIDVARRARRASSAGVPPGGQRRPARSRTCRCTCSIPYLDDLLRHRRAEGADELQGRPSLGARRRRD